MADKLSMKQLKFIDEYMVDFNATQAAYRAGYGIKKTSAATQGCVLLKDPKIRAEVDRRFKESGINALRLVEELHEISLNTTIDNVDGLKYSDKINAIDKLLRVAGAYKDKMDHTTGGQPFQPIVNVAVYKEEDFDE